MYPKIMFIVLLAFIVQNAYLPDAKSSSTYITYPTSRYRNYNYLQPNHNKHITTNHKRYLTQRNFCPHTQNSFSDLNALEKYALNRTYSRESSLERLERLETVAFGAIQSGDINTRYDIVRNAILARPQNNYKTSLLRNLGNYFGGQLTGYTPQMGFRNDPFFSTSSSTATTLYPTTYGNKSFNEYTTPFGSGYQIHNYGVGNNAGIPILH